MNMPPDEHAIRSMLQGVDIPPCPRILIDVDHELKKDAPDQREIARLIARDVSLAGHVIRIANSPAFNAGRPLDSLPQALNMLGTQQVLNLVVVQLLKVALDGPPDVAMDRFWESSANVARVCAELARRLHCCRPDVAYTFGLFHDCGIPLMMKRFPQTKEVLGQANQDEEHSFTAAEEQAFGTNHAVVGYFLAKRWCLPGEICEAIQLHHDYAIFGDSSNVADNVRKLVALCVLAEHIIGLHSRNSTDCEWSKAASSACEIFDVSLAATDDLIEDMLDWLG